MKWQFNDGGRSVTGYTGKTRDCVCRAIAIAAEKPYQEIYDRLNEIGKLERRGKRKRSISDARTGVYRFAYQRLLFDLGFVWTATMKIGSGCNVHLREGELPDSGRLVVSVSKHLCAVIDGVVHDTHDPSRGGTRCVYGYYQKVTL